MKKLLALLLCCVLLICLLTACIDDVSEPEAAVATPADIETGATEASAAEITTEASEEHDHVHINYKGLEAADFTLDDVIAAEGREPDFSFDVGEATYYAYNDVALEDMTFTQVQFSFSDTGNRISCTYSGEEDQNTVMESYREALTALFGEPTVSGDTYSWRDGHTANYVMMTALNETTVQVAFYIVEVNAE